jgi:transcriptional regulator GlxA family with amidase domain
MSCGNKARWVVDGSYYTSSGVSAGMDMALGFIADHYGQEKAAWVGTYTEYVANSDASNDPFAAA